MRTNNKIPSVNIVILNVVKNLSKLNLLRFFALLRKTKLKVGHHIYLSILIISTLNNPALAQEINLNDTVNISEVVVTANRSFRYIEDIPGRVTVIDSKMIDELPVQTVDEILRYIANVNVNRSWGIFSKNSSVTMRGLDGSSRVLVLLDGAPMNKSAGGLINWSMISVSTIDKIEVIKGPASTIYGNNAMAGVISIITKNPTKPIEGEAGFLISSYNTFGGNLNLSGTNVKNNKGFIWSINSFYRQGDGYYLEPEDIRDSNDVKAGLQEYNIAGKVGYNFSANQKIEVRFQTYDDYRGQGRQVYEDLGDYVSLNTNYFQANYQGIFNKTLVNALAFYQYENEFKQTESISTNSGKYKLSERDSDKNDYGLWMNATTYLSDKNTLTYGVDIKSGNAMVTTTYITSTDVLKYDGNLDFIGFYIQDEIKLLNDKIIIEAGARMDFAKYYNGSMDAENPTSNTGFINPVDESFPSSSWSAFSPKVAVRYKFNKANSVYISYSNGFMPPKLDDLSKSGKIRKGFKIANPELGPEYITNYEVGFNLKLFEKLTIEPSIYYSIGKDFQYFVGTGDSIDSGGDIPKPIYQRQNIAEVEVIGAEITFNYLITENIRIAANYTFNHSTIKEYTKPDSYEKDITGKYLIEVPRHMAYMGFGWRNKYFNTTISYNYISSQWYDDENTILIEGYDMVDIQVSKNFAKKYTVSLDIQNIFDNEYIDRKGYLSPGRFITAEIKIKF